MTDDAGPHDTDAALLATLRDCTGRPDLEFADGPHVLSGGFYAEMRRFRLADPPDDLGGELVARIVPDPAIGAWESTIQRTVARQGFPTPAVRLTAPASSPLGRFLTVMDMVDGRPPLAGLSSAAVVTRLPHLVRRLPVDLATMAARLHELDPGPLLEELEALDGGLPTTTSGFVGMQMAHSSALGRDELVDAGVRLLDREPRGGRAVITHGDLHPFNLLVTTDGPMLIDWTVARVAHPAFTVAFTQLLLDHPPLPPNAVLDAVLAPATRGVSRRFLARYRALAGSAGRVDDDQLAWHRGVHALRILVEMARWEQDGVVRPSGHPWTVIEPFARQELGLA